MSDVPDGQKGFCIDSLGHLLVGPVQMQKQLIVVVENSFNTEVLTFVEIEPCLVTAESLCWRRCSIRVG